MPNLFLGNKIIYVLFVIILCAMRRFTAWLNMIATFAVLSVFYTGLNALTNGSIDPFINIYYSFIAMAVALVSIVNSMLYINTVHKDIDELQKNNKISNNKSEN